MSKPEIISLAFTDTAVEVEGVRSAIEPVEAFTLRALMKHKPGPLTTNEIAEMSDDFPRTEITRGIRNIVPKVNARHEVIGIKRQAGTGTRLYSLFEHVVETSFSTSSEYKVTDPYWMDDAACDLNSAPLFNTTEHGKNRQLGRVKKTFCDVCPVLDDCLADAIISGNNFGIRGGLLPDERQPLIEAHQLFIKQSRDVA